MEHLNGRMVRNILGVGKKVKCLDMVFLFIRIMYPKICWMGKLFHNYNSHYILNSNKHYNKINKNQNNNNHKNEKFIIF